jgi:uncharacterized protein involved in oxidation of intracellular sulfur
MKTLFILNDPPYGTERNYNALRLAGALSSHEGEQVRLFLIGDAASCGKSGQKPLAGFYNLQLMLDKLVRNKADVAVCGTCMDARGIAESDLVKGTHRGTLEELAGWTQWADKVIVF